MGHLVVNLGHFSKVGFCFFAFLFFNIGISYSNPIFDFQNFGTVYSIESGQKALYLGGENGLFKVSGVNVSKYQGQSISFYGADIEDLYEDSNGDVWIATFGKGMHILRSSSVISASQLFGFESPPYCRNIIGYDNHVFFTCNAKLYKYNIKNSLVEIVIDGLPLGISDITSIVHFNGNFALVNNYSELYFLVSGTLKKMTIASMVSLPSEINTLFFDGGKLWIGTDNGVLLFDIDKNRFEAIRSLSEYGPISKIFKPNKDEIWIYQSGFKKIKIEDVTLNDWESLKSVSEQLPQTIFDVHVLQNNSLIYSAPIIGVSHFSSFHKAIENTHSAFEFKETISHSSKHGKDTFVFANDKVFHFEKSDIIDITFPNTNFLNAAAILSKKEFVLFTEENGIQNVKVDSEHNALFEEIEFQHNYGSIATAVEVVDGTVLFSLIGGEDQGLYRMLADKTIEPLIPGFSADVLHKRKNGNIAAVTRFSGVFPDIARIEKTTLGQSQHKYVNNCLIEDSKGVLWICTDGGGLGYYDENLNTTVFIDPKYTADSRHIRDLVEDSDGFLWVMTNNGLVRYDHQSSQSIQVGEEEGVKDIDFEITASIKLTNDRILVAGDTKNYIINTKLANAFLNKRLEQTTKAIFVDLSVRSRDFHGLQHNTNKLLDSLKHDRPVEFLADEFLFNITFAADNFVDRKILGYQYRLLGLDDQWTDAKPYENTATFSTLPTGDYRFQLRIFDPKSKAEQPISSLKIRVMPPFWQTWQAYSLYILGTAILLFFGAKYRTYKLKKLNKRLEKTVADNTVDLAKSQNKLARLLNQKEKLYANASHELKTPLTLISGPIDNLDEMDLPGKAKQELVVIKRNSQRLMTIVEQILELSSADAQTLNKKIPYDIKQSIDVIVTSFQPLVQIKNLSLHLNNTITCHAVLVSDSLEKILSNLLLNAYKYTQANKSVYINASNTHREFCLEVRDEGIGIKSEYVKTIFDRFTRLDNMPENNGSGLGLAVVQELVRSNGGEISVESTEEVGTTFRIVIPIVAASEVDDEIVSEPTTKLANDINSFFEEEAACILNTGELPTVLLVEDHQDMRSLLFRVLSPSYNCISAKDGFEAFEKAMECVPDLIITDLMMPNCDGFEFTDKVRSNEITSHIPIVMLTAKGDNNTKLIGWEHQVDEFMTKPFNAKALRVRIANLLLIRKSIAQKFGQTDTDENTNQIFRLNSSDFHSDRDKRFFQKFISWLETNYSKETVSRKDASSALAVSERQLNRKLNALTNYSFNELLRKFRMGKAITEIKSGKAISVVAYETGFATPSYFSNRFKEEYGMSPSLFLEKYSDSLKPSK